MSLHFSRVSISKKKKSHSYFHTMVLRLSRSGGWPSQEPRLWSQCCCKRSGLRLGLQSRWEWADVSEKKSSEMAADSTGTLLSALMGHLRARYPLLLPLMQPCDITSTPGFNGVLGDFPTASQSNNHKHSVMQFLFPHFLRIYHFLQLF